MTPAAHGRDLEAIVSLMEMAAVELTTSRDATFTADELFAAAATCGGPSIALVRVDFDIVLDNARFVRRVPGGRWQLK